MKTGLSIYLVILILAATVIDFFILKTTSFPPSNTQEFSASTDRHIYVRGDVESMEVTTAATGYYRISSGEAVLEGEHLIGDYFQGKAQLSPGEWVIEDGETITFSVTSSVPVSVELVSTAGTYWACILITVVLAALFFFLGYAISEVA